MASLQGSSRGYQYDVRRRSIADMPPPDASKPQAFWANTIRDFDGLGAGEALFFELPEEHRDPAAERERVNVQRMRGRIKKQFDHYRPKRAQLVLDYGRPGSPPGVWAVAIDAPEAVEQAVADRGTRAPTLPDTPAAAAAGHDDPDRYFPAADAEAQDDANAALDKEPDFATEYQPTDLDIPPGMADDDEEDEEIPPVAKKKHCGCPLWWKDDSAWRPQLADKFGAHHFAECALYLPAPIVEKVETICSCDPFVVAGRDGFRADVANEGHEKTCPMYREGAHWWQIPNGASNFEGYTQVCRWCGAVKEIPGTGSDSMPVRLPEKRKGPRICPDCGQGYASAAHRAHKAGANA